MTKIFTLGELHRRSDSELQTLFRMISAGVADSRTGTRECYAQLASLDNIRKTLRLRQTRQVRPAVGF